MDKKFIAYIKKEKLIHANQKTLLAVSGGIDSVCMAQLFYNAGFPSAIAHCNFTLRGKESGKEEIFVRKLAAKLKMPFFVVRFDTEKYASEHGISIQMAARKLRYDWFEEICEKEKYHCIATAHHSDDEAETFFINLIRGTGISGLKGYSPKNGKIIKPMLFANRVEIEQYAKAEKIIYCTDSSNASDKYLRNKIRHRLIPLFEEIHPGFKKTLASETERIATVYQIAEDYIQNLSTKLIVRENNGIKIRLDLLLKQHAISFILFSFLKPYGFTGNIVDSIVESLQHTEEKAFYSHTHVLIKNRTFLQVAKREVSEGKQEFVIRENDTLFKGPVTLKMALFKNCRIHKNQSFAFLDYSKLKFPLLLRNWHEGDYFIPFGMKGKKKLSDYFTDLKLSSQQKSRIWLLCSANGDIVWVLGHRIDNRYKVQSDTLKTLKIELK